MQDNATRIQVEDLIQYNVVMFYMNFLVNIRLVFDITLGLCLTVIAIFDFCHAQKSFCMFTTALYVELKMSTHNYAMVHLDKVTNYLSKYVPCMNIVLVMTKD